MSFWGCPDISRLYRPIISDANDPTATSAPNFAVMHSRAAKWLELQRAVIPDGKKDRVAVQPGQSQIKTV
jgi:hypothetical protein